MEVDYIKKNLKKQKQNFLDKEIMFQIFFFLRIS